MSWKAVCKADEIEENALKFFDIDDIEFVVIRVADGFVAIPAYCPHMEEPLAESGMCGGGLLTCSKHLWQWDLASGEARGETEKPLLMYQVRQDGDDVMVLLDEELVYDWDDDEDED